MKRDDDIVCDIIEEILRREKVDTQFNIGLIPKYEYYEENSENKEDSSGGEL